MKVRLAIAKYDNHIMFRTVYVGIYIAKLSQAEFFYDFHTQNKAMASFEWIFFKNRKTVSIWIQSFDL